MNLKSETTGSTCRPTFPSVSFDTFPAQLSDITLAIWRQLKQLGGMKMSLGLWQLREAKRALTIFCEDNNLAFNDDVALRAAHELLRIAQQRPGTTQQLLRHLEEDTASRSKRQL